ncbi:hypothetical protein [Streptomyces sp. NPDC054834]
MDADRFWAVTGIVAGIERAGFKVLAPNRLPQPWSWDAEVEHLAPCLPERPVSVVAGSNLDGQTVRGVSDSELSALTMPIGVLPAVPENPSHQRHTVDTLRQLLPHSEELEGCPEPPLPAFAAHLDRFPRD